MKKIRNLIVCLLVVAMTVSLSSCSKKPVGEDKFRDIMEDKYGFEITERPLSDGEEQFLLAKRGALDITASFVLFEDEDAAKDDMEETIERIEEDKEEGEFDGTIKKSGSGDFEKVVIEGENSMYDTYEILVRCDNIIIYVFKTLPEKDDVKEVNKIIKDFGY